MKNCSFLPKTEKIFEIMYWMNLQLYIFSKKAYLPTPRTAQNMSLTTNGKETKIKNNIRAHFMKAVKYIINTIWKHRIGLRNNNPGQEIEG